MDGNTSPLPNNPLIGKRTTVVRVAGQAKKATLFDNTVVHRKEIIEFWMGEQLTRVRIAPYYNHFCYVTPKHILGWSLLCTCGSMAGVVGFNQYKKDGSPTSGGDGLEAGELLVCLSHAESGRHSDNST